MAEHEEIPPAVEDDEETPGYKPPAPKSLNEIQNLDQEDESLRKYKDALLGQTTNSVIGETLGCELYDGFQGKLSAQVQNKEPHLVFVPTVVPLKRGRGARFQRSC